MALHATARSSWAERRLMAHIEGLTLTGSPTISGADDPARSASSGPWVRLTFDEATHTPAGRFSATQSARELRLLVTADIFWPAPETRAPASDNLQGAQDIADELREALMFLALDFYDYTTPASPVTVADCVINVQRVDPIRRLPDDDGFRRRQVRAYADWIGRFDDYFA